MAIGPVLVRVPLLKVRLASVCGLLPRLTIAPLIVSVPGANGPLKVAVPPDAVVLAAVNASLKVTETAEMVTFPAELTVAPVLKAMGVPLRLRVVPAAPVNGPLLVPLAVRLNVPDWRLTEPVLLKGMLKV